MRTSCACVSCARVLKEWIDDRVQAVIDGKVAASGGDVRLLLAQERRRRRALPPQGHRLRVLPQLPGVQPVGQHDLPDHGRAGRRARRPGRPVVVRADDASARTTDGAAFTAARPVRDGAVPHDLTERGQPLVRGDDGRRGVPRPQRRHPAPAGEPGPVGLWRHPEEFDPDRYLAAPTSGRQRRGAGTAGRPGPLPLPARTVQTQRRPPGRADQQRLRRRLQRRRRHGATRCATRPATRPSASATAAAAANSSPSSS